MIPSREELVKEAEKLSVKLSGRDLTELFFFNGEYFATRNLSDVTQVTQAEAIEAYIHPDSKDHARNPLQYFPGLETLDNNWTKEKAEVLFKTPAGAIFLYSDNFSGFPAVSMELPGSAMNHICKNIDGNPKDIYHYNGVFFQFAKGQYAHIDERKALDIYLSMRSIDINPNPEQFFALKTIATDHTEEQSSKVSKTLETADGKNFTVSIKQDGSASVRVNRNTAKKTITHKL